MRIRFVVSATTLAMIVATILLQAVAGATPPNVLILLADDLGYGDVGFNGGERIATPNLDRLAATGVNLTDFRACPMCSPTRAGLMTGRWPLRFGMMRAVVPPWSTYGLPTEESTLPQLLAEVGYERRGIVGKWHLGHARQAFLPGNRGFTRFLGCYNGAIDYFTHEREGETDWHHDLQTVKEEGYSTDLIGDEAVRLIEQSPENQPWFLYVPFNAPHSPYQAKPEDLQKYPDLKIRDRRAFAAMVDSMDQAIGRILAATEARSDASNTLVLFFSDNGGIPRVGSSNGPFRGGKLSVYEGGTRVCAAIRWPDAGLTGGTRFDERIGYIDVVPTILAAAGAEATGDLDGLNFIPAIRGQDSIPTRPWFSYIHQSQDAQASVHLDHWKLVAHGDFFDQGAAPAATYELYDLSTDAAETTNLFDQEPRRGNELRQLLKEFGSWGAPGVKDYAFGRDGFVAPKDWVIETP